MLTLESAWLVLHQKVLTFHSKLRPFCLKETQHFRILRQQHQTISITIGKPIQKQLINSFISESDCTRYIRQRTYLLQCQHEKKQLNVIQHEAIVESDNTLLESELALLNQHEIGRAHV